LTPRVLVIDTGAVLVLGCLGVLGAWLMRRFSTLAARNLYPPALTRAAALAAGVALHAWNLVLITSPIAALTGAAALYARRLRLADLGAGEELRAYELARRWIWQPAPARRTGERVYLHSQGELVHTRPWPPSVGYVSMSRHDHPSLRLPLGDGQHIFACGATGSGKTTSMRRVLAARTLDQGAALLILDQKGDHDDVEQASRLAAKAGVPFVLIDPQDPCSDRYQPLWGTPSQVAARAVEPIKQSEPYYYDILRLHLDVVARVLHAADRWPPSIPFLIDAAHPDRYPDVRMIANGLATAHRDLARRVEQHATFVSSRKGTDDLAGGAARLQVALALASREVVTPRHTPDGQAVAVGLVEALKARAVVMWRMHGDVMPDEAAAMTVLALADLHDAAAQASAPWTLMLDEFGAVIKMAANRAVAILQRGRSHGGQVIVVTQSVADPEALSGQTGLLASLTDNFSGIVAHRQTAPESRDWLAKLMGTRALWQSTNQTTGHGSQHSGRGSARRANSASAQTPSRTSSAVKPSSTPPSAPNPNKPPSNPKRSSPKNRSASAPANNTPARWPSTLKTSCRRAPRHSATQRADLTTGVAACDCGEHPSAPPGRRCPDDRG
jgi:TraM recognition site of TraD and TraG/Type IV secretion-system coupling protein DNA-binding domain